VGIRPGSDQFVTKGLSLSVVHTGPEHPKVVPSVWLPVLLPAAVWGGAGPGVDCSLVKHATGMPSGVVHGGRTLIALVLVVVPATLLMSYLSLIPSGPGLKPSRYVCLDEVIGGVTVVVAGLLAYGA
jgi:hypothetical protein